MVTLESITADNLEEVLAVSGNEDQRRFVSPVAESLAQAYVYPKTAFPFAVRAGDKIVGFIMMGYYEAKDYYTLWKFLIDKDHQNKGYGKQALLLGIDFLKDRFGVSEIYTGVIPDNAVAKKLYLSAGFEETGLFENGMEELRLRL